MSQSQGTSLDRSFLRRVKVTTLVMSLIGVVFVALYGGGRPALGWLAGTGVALMNFQFLEWILVRVLRPQPLLGPKVTLALAAKIPFVIGTLLLATKVANLPLLWFSLGFFLLFVVVSLKAATRFLLSRQGVKLGDPSESPLYRIREKARSDKDESSNAARGGVVALGIGGAILLSALAPSLPGIDSAQDQWTTRVSVTESADWAWAADETDPHAGHDHGDGSHGAADAHGDAAAGDLHGDGHGDGHEESAVSHFPNLITYVEFFLRKAGIDAPWVNQLHKWENIFFCMLVGIFLAVVSSIAVRRNEAVPGRLQSAVEMAVGGLYDFIKGILGDDARRYLPFVGTLFFYIWGMNWLGLIPGGKSPTAYLNTTLALALCVFLYVQYTGITRLGIGGWLHHLAGSPNDPVGWALVPLMFPLEIIGEIAKPVSLSLRLFGNVMGEDTLLALFSMLVVVGLPFAGLNVGIPLHVPFMFLALLASAIQALVFMLLATIYLSQMTPHEDH